MGESHDRVGRLGWYVAVLGVPLCVVGWYGVSGERLAARQLPYLASATVPGAALIVAGAVLTVGRSTRTAVPTDRQETAAPAGPGCWTSPLPDRTPYRPIG